MINNTEKIHLQKLIDDESEVVESAIVRRLKAEGPEGEAFLRDLSSRSEDPRFVRRIRHLLGRIGAMDPQREFVAFIRSCRYDLESGCVLLERAFCPAAETEHLRPFLDGLAARVDEFLEPGLSPFEGCKRINRVMFWEYGFDGDRETYEDPDNSFLGRVIARRRGLPISLSTLYLLVAWRCGLHLEPIGLPGRFCLGCFEDRDPFFIDAFERGRIRSEIEIRQILNDQGIDDPDSFLMPCPIGEMLQRYCRNLVRHFSLRDRPGDAALAASFIREFDAVYLAHEG